MRDYEELLEILRDKILMRIDLTQTLSDEELQKTIHSVIMEEDRNTHIPLLERSELGKQLFHSFRRLDLLEVLLEDPEISEIMVNGEKHIFVEKHGTLFAERKVFPSRQKLEDIIQQIAAGSNRIVNEASPIADARLPDGSRVNIVLPPVALDGPAVTIRKFPENPLTMKKLIEMGSVTSEAAAFLKRLVISRYNIFISGGTGSGKTTFLNALSEFIPADERIVTIEDNAELKLLEKPNLVRLETRNPNTEGTGEISIRTLIRTALRMRPDRIIVGEVRQEEAVDMIQAMNTGHDGSLSTGHANSPVDMLARLETMVLMGMELPLSAIQRQLASGIDFLIHLGRLRDGSRKVFEIVEITGYREGTICLNPIFSFYEGGLRKVGTLKNSLKLETAGFSSVDS